MCCLPSICAIHGFQEIDELTKKEKIFYLTIHYLISPITLFVKGVLILLLVLGMIIKENVLACLNKRNESFLKLQSIRKEFNTSFLIVNSILLMIPVIGHLMMYNIASFKSSKLCNKNSYLNQSVAFVLYPHIWVDSVLEAYSSNYTLLN